MFCGFTDIAIMPKCTNVKTVNNHSCTQVNYGNTDDVISNKRCTCAFMVDAIINISIHRTLLTTKKHINKRDMSVQCVINHSERNDFLRGMVQCMSLDSDTFVRSVGRDLNIITNCTGIDGPVSDQCLIYVFHITFAIIPFLFIGIMQDDRSFIILFLHMYITVPIVHA